MNPDFAPAASENNFLSPDVTLWRELIAQTAHGDPPAQWLTTAFDFLSQWMSYDFALALEFSCSQPHIHILAQHHELPPTFRTDFETFELPAEYIDVLDTPRSLENLEQALEGLRELLSRFHYGSPVLVPLTADHRALGVLMLVRNPHPETSESRDAEFARVRIFLPPLGDLLGAALQRARLQAQLDRVTTRFDAFIENGRDAFWETDAGLNLVYVNQAARDLIGLEEADILGPHLAQLFVQRLPLLGTDLQGYENFLAALLERDAVDDFRVPVMTADGVISVSVSARVRRDAVGNLLGIRGTAHNVTLHLKAQQELEQRTRELEWLYELAQRLNKLMDPRQAMQEVLELIAKMLDADAIALGLIDAWGEQFNLAAHYGVADELVKAYSNLSFRRIALQPDFDPELAASAIEYLIASRRVLTTQDFSSPRFNVEMARRFGFKSLLAFPMRFETNVYGMVFLGSLQPAHFDAHGTRLGTSISAQLGLALHTHHLIQVHERNAKQANMLAVIGQKIQYAPRAEQVLHMVARDIKQVLEADYVVLQLVRVEHFEIVTATDMRETVPRHPIADYERRIFDTDAPVQVTDCELPDVDPVQREILRGLAMRAVISMRLFAHDHPLGILFVNYAQPRRWREDEIEFVRRVAQQIAYALENKRLLDESVKQLKIQRALENAARLIASVLTPEEALHTVADELIRVFQVDYVGFHLLENDRLVLVAESGETGAPRELPVAPHQHLILRELETRVVYDRDKESLPPTQRQVLEQDRFCADIGTPLVVGKDALGILYLAQYTPRAWTDAEIRLAETFARHIAVALQNVRLFRESKVQVRDLRALARSAQLIASSRSLPDALPFIAAEFKRVMEADYVGFHLVEGDSLRVVTEYHSKYAGQIYPIANYHRLVLKYGQRIVVNDIETDARDKDHYENLKNTHLRADIAVPLVSRNRPIGIVFVSQAVPRVWRDAEIRLVETFAQQIASVLDLVQVLNDRQVRVHELEVLTELHEYTLTMPGREALQELVLPLLQNLMGADNVVLAFVEGNTLSSARAGNGRLYTAQPLTVTPTIQTIFQTKEMFVFDAEHPHTFSPDEQARLAFHRMRALLAVPMIAADGVVGLLNVVYETARVFSEREKQLAQAIANQLAMAVANTRLLEQQQQRVARSSKLTDFALFCNAMQESRTLQTEVVRRICDMLSMHAASVRLVEDGWLTPGTSFGYRNAGAREHPIRIEGWLEQILQHQQPFEIPDLASATDLPSHWRERHLEEGFNAGLIVPMLVAGQVMGVLTLFHLEPHHWVSLETQYARTIANILALALANLQAKERAALKSQELQATMDSVFSGVLTTDAEGVILSWNREAERITGYPESAMIGKRWDKDGPRVGTSQRDDTLILEAMTDRQARFGLATRYFARADGQVITLREVATPLLDTGQNVRGAVGAFWDRTQEQAAERQKIDFINETAHQLNTKLGAVVMSARRLLRGGTRDKMREQYTRVIQDTVQDLQDFQERFAAFELEHVTTEPAEALVRVRAVLDEQIAALRVREPRRRVLVKGEFGRVMADPARLRVVLANLLDNAYKYSPPRSQITLTASCPTRDTFVLKIHNRGAPIPPHLLPHLFERRQRGNVNVPGSGLGLWLVRTKLYEMGGEIECASSAKKGTAVTVTLRRRPPARRKAADS